MPTLLNAIRDWLVYELQEDEERDDHDLILWIIAIAAYRSLRTGRIIPAGRVLSASEGFTGFAQDQMLRHTQQLITGKIDIRQWQSLMRIEIKDAHIVNAMAGRGGKNAMTRADWGRVGGRLRQQYGYLDNFAWEIQSGAVSEAQMLARVQMYANKSRTAYFDGRTAACQAAELTEERRILNPAEHCADCIGYASLGWVAIGTLPEPGEGSVCRANCKCNKEFR